jgi:hypothetical protein
MMRVIHSLIVLALAALVVVDASGPARAADAPAFVLIVHPSNPVTEVDRDFLREAYLRSTGNWSSGDSVRPVDLSRRFGAREGFTKDVLRKSLPQLKRYWNQQIFSGKGVPPPELDSEKAMIAYVLANRGAVGYLPAGADAGGARVVKVK